MDNQSAKAIVAILTSRTDLLEEVLSGFKDNLGRTDFTGPWRPFMHTRYYEPEMGDGLKRCIVSFENIISADILPQMKSWTREIESRFKAEGKRTVNIDPGYVDLHKVVLGSGKGGGHMILISNGVFADVLLWFNKGWQTFPWSYPDFKDGTYFEELLNIRNRLKIQIHQ